LTPEPPRLRLEMPFLLMAGMVLSAFMGCVGLFGSLLHAAGAFSSTEIFAGTDAGGFRSALQSGTLVAFVFWLALGAVAWGLWREQW
jgi:hypothetical protein